MKRMAAACLCLLVAACGGGTGSSPDADPADATTPDASTGCVVDDDCGGALVCVDSLCQPEGCEVGTEGCACGAGDRCSSGSDGFPLSCAEGICSSATCPAGTTGCVCVDGEGCASEGDVCAVGFCVSADCEAGASGCPCLVGTCDVGLSCLDGALCVDDDGYEGGPCLESGRCHRGLRCEASLDVCAFCELGGEGCGCSDAGTCSGGLACAADLCVDGAELPPTDPVCYTPCRDDLDADGVVLTCDADGLLAGCVGDLECLDGSCVVAGDAKPSCADDLDCPFFQACLLGGCYSNCESSVDCGSGLSCHERVCRVPCETSAGAASCGAGEYCDADDGVNGHCVILSMGDASAPDTASGGGVSVTELQLAFSNVRTSLPFEVVALDEELGSHLFTVRRLWHEISYADGSSENVTAERDPETGELGACAGTDCPLWWLDLTTPGRGSSREPELQVSAVGGCFETGSCPEIMVSNAGGVDAVRWTGAFEVAGNGARLTMTLSYVQRPEGQWAGTMHYFGTFPEGGVETWAARADKSDVSGVENGLLRKWGAFRGGSLSDGWQEMVAILTATRTGSWAFGEVSERCPSSSGACYPYTNTTGVRSYVTNLSATPIPAGVTELPFAMNLRQPGLTATRLEGAIDSASSLHYPGGPSISLELATDPSSATSCDPGIADDCVVWLSDLSATAIVGGRYLSDDGSCASGFIATEEPWLIEGFSAGTSADGTGRRYRTVCVDGELPLDTSSDAAFADRNRSLAGANPVPDGVARSRGLRLLDGALVNQSVLFFFFEESFESFVADGASDEVTAYGYVTLQRSVVDLDESDDDGDGVPDVYQGNVPPTVSRAPSTMAGASCDAALVADIVPGATELGGLSSPELLSFVDVLLNGTTAASATPIPTADVHYYCEESGLFDGGEGDDGTSLATSIECPAGSRVVFFTTPGLTQAQVAAEPCQEVVCTSRLDEEALPDAGTFEFTDEGDECTRGTCQARLEVWRASGVVELYEPSYRCDDADTAYCDSDRLDLRSGKTFYRPPAAVDRSFNGLQNDVDAAFRYRTRFTSSTGSRPGFAPQVCIPDSDQIPYCYDPAIIEGVRDRVDCLIAVYSDTSLIGALPTSCAGGVCRSTLERFLEGNFAQYTDRDGDRDGFERLYSELLVMQGDEALTQAFGSRFDLAGVSGASFEGSLIEPGGIDLSGVAGAEMVALHRAVQLYQMALDRLYSLGPDMSEALSRNVSVDSSQVFMSAESVVLYLERLIRASTQKARAYAEIAKSYQTFNRPDLARAVVERAYSAAYMEAVVLEQLMDAISDASSRADRPQIELTITQAQRRYRLALVDMRDVYASLSDDVHHFGYAPDYVPFPALDASAAGPTGTGPVKNAFEVLLIQTKTLTDQARVRETLALESNRSFQASSGSFQAELVRLRNGYEDDLAALCGTFVSPLDDRVYPAIRRYAPLHPDAELFGDPCGLMGNGAIHEQLVDHQVSLIENLQIAVRIENVFEQIEAERSGLSAQCGEILDLASYEFDQAGEASNLELALHQARTDKQVFALQMQAAMSALGILTDQAGAHDGAENGRARRPTLGQRLSASIGSAIRAGVQYLISENTEAAEEEIAGLETDIADFEAESARWQTESRCDAALIDGDARTATTLLGLRVLELEMLKAEWRSNLALEEIIASIDRAQRFEDQQEEAESLLIDVEAARSDPNVRVYRNDAMINADVAFGGAMRAAYRLTRVYEYYTSQSYARREQLFLIRMVSAGDYNLDNYLIDLENAFFDFEELYGAPDTRVLQLSLMEDVLRVPMLADDGTALTDEERLTLLRERVQDVDLLDNRGYLTMGFSTDLERLSPLTRNHKLVYIEAEFAGGASDHVGRLYLTPAGTGVIAGLDGATDYYVLPERTAVLNPFFNGNRVFTSEVYQSLRLRDRPLLNTHWQLVFNQRDEPDNDDIQLETLTDIRLYLYYSDFTAL